MSTEVCEHGSLQRACRICELEDDLNLMYRTLDEMRRERQTLRLNNAAYSANMDTMRENIKRLHKENVILRTRLLDFCNAITDDTFGVGVEVTELQKLKQNALELLKSEP